MDKARIVEIKKKIYTLLDCNGFEKKLNSGEPFTFSYIKHGDSFELEIRFPKDEFECSPMVATLSFPRFNLKSELQCSYDLYEKTGNSFLESIYKSFAEEYKNFFFKEIKEDLK